MSWTKRTPRAGETAEGMTQGDKTPMSATDRTSIADGIWAHAQDLARKQQALHDGQRHLPDLMLTQRLIQEADTGSWVEDENRRPGWRAVCGCGWEPSQVDDFGWQAEARFFREHLGIDFPVASSLVDEIDFTDGQGVCAHHCGFDGLCVTCGDEIGF